MWVRLCEGPHRWKTTGRKEPHGEESGRPRKCPVRRNRSASGRMRDSPPPEHVFELSDVSECVAAAVLSRRAESSQSAGLVSAHPCPGYRPSTHSLLRQLSLSLEGERQAFRVRICTDLDRVRLADNRLPRVTAELLQVGEVPAGRVPKLDQRVGDLNQSNFQPPTFESSFGKLAGAGHRASASPTSQDENAAVRSSCSLVARIVTAPD